MQRTMTALAALLLMLSTGTTAYTQGTAWKTLNDDAMALYKQGHYDRAVVVAKEALQVAEQAHGPDHPDVATRIEQRELLARHAKAKWIAKLMNLHKTPARCARLFR